MSKDSGMVSERVRLYRVSSGLSQAALAEKANLHSTYIGQIERGEKNPTVETVLKIANALNLAPEQFFTHLPSSSDTMSTIEECYQLLLGLSPQEQQHILEIIRHIIAVKNSN